MLTLFGRVFNKGRKEKKRKEKKMCIVEQIRHPLNQFFWGEHWTFKIDILLI
jgi:hypothetical protein